jgi:dihydroflavonol-4-reductase
LTRRIPIERPGDPPIEWVVGDLREASDRRKALAGVRGVVHSASWVMLGSDPKGEGASINVGATRGLLADAIAAGSERFVYTSTLHTLAAGSAEDPASEDSAWNLARVDSPYARTKREAEAIVLDGLGGKLPGLALCPGMVIGPRDPKPTSTSLLLLMARSPVALLPGGGIPVVDARVAALAHTSAMPTWPGWSAG